MTFLSREQLEALGFKSLGKNVQISDKATIYYPEEIEIGDHSRIDDFCVVSGRLRIGRNVHIAVFGHLSGGSEGVRMDDFSGLSFGSHVFAQSDDFSGLALTNPTVPMAFRKVTSRPVHVGRHCIIGANSVVLPGVELAEGTGVGAMTLVSESTEPWSIYAGIPARRLGERRRTLLELEERYLGAGD